MNTTIKWVESKQIRESMGKPPPGQFALSPAIPNDESLSWERCRERWSNAFTQDVKGFFFSHEEGASDNIAAFIDKTEEIIGVEKSGFGKTNRRYAIWVAPSSFWTLCGMRRSLYTILLRAGLAYHVDQDNYEQALFNQEYVKDTKQAVIRFLYGFTKFVEGIGWSSCRGWVTQFRGQPTLEITKHLVSVEPVNLPLIGVGSLWR